MIKYNSYATFIDWTLVSPAHYQGDYDFAVQNNEFELEAETEAENKARAAVALLNLASENKFQDFMANQQNVVNADEDFVKEVFLIPLADALLMDGQYPDEKEVYDDEDLYTFIGNHKTSDGKNALITFSTLNHAKIPAVKLENFKKYVSKLSDTTLVAEILAPIKHAEDVVEVQLALDSLLKDVELRAKADAEAELVRQDFSNFYPTPEVDSAEMEKLEAQLVQAKQMEADLAAKQQLEAEQQAAEVAAMEPLDFDAVDAQLQAVKEEDNAFAVNSDSESEEEEEEKTVLQKTNTPQRLLFPVSSSASSLSQSGSATKITLLNDSLLSDLESVAVQASKPSLWERFKQKWQAVPTRAKVAAGVFTVLSLAAVALGIFLPPSLAITVPLLKISSSTLLISAGAAVAGTTLLGHAAHIAAIPAPQVTAVTTSQPASSHQVINRGLRIDPSMEVLPVADRSLRSPLGDVHVVKLHALAQNDEDVDERYISDLSADEEDEAEEEYTQTSPAHR